MRSIFLIILTAAVITSCNKIETKKPWNIKIEDGSELYDYSGVTYPSADGWSASFQSFSGFQINGNNEVTSFNTKSQFSVKFGNFSGLNFNLIFNTNDSLTLVNLNSAKPHSVRFQAFNQVVKKGTYSFTSMPNSPFIFYTDKQDNLWVTDFSQNNFLEVISTTPNTQDATANELIAQINFDLGLKGFSSNSTKRIKGTIFSFFTLN